MGYAVKKTRTRLTLMPKSMEKIDREGSAHVHKQTRLPITVEEGRATVLVIVSTSSTTPPPHNCLFPTLRVSIDLWGSQNELFLRAHEELAVFVGVFFP